MEMAPPEFAALTELAARLGRQLRQRGLLLVTAESCTGGGLSFILTSSPGSSQWFERGFVTYSDAAKRELLDVPGELLQRRGAVSVETARAMTEGALRHSRAQVAVAVTGVAGPAGGTAANPVGAVCLAWQLPGAEPRAERKRFAGDRAAVRLQTCRHALEELLRLLAS